MQKILQDRSHVRIHKTNLNKFKKTKIIANIFTNDNEMKLEVNRRRKTGKFTNRWKLSNTLTNESKKKIKW